MLRTPISAFLLFACLSVAAQPAVLQRLESSPRHQEWVEIKAGGDRVVHAFVVHPEKGDKATAVIVIHENRGLTDWVRSFADELAEAGYIAIAPDLLSGFDAQHAKTSDFASSDAAREALYKLDPARVLTDLDAVRAHAAKLESGNGKVAVAGFCWGGGQTFRYATHSPDVAGAFVFYGPAPTEPDAVAAIKAPVFGFYGANDERINAGIPAIGKLMQEHRKAFDAEIYPGAGHAFMRGASEPGATPETIAARDAAWKRLVGELAKLQ